MIIWEGVDKREFPRVSYRCLIKVKDHGRDETFETHTENIGAGGLCVVLSKEFDLFKTASIELFVEENGDPISCKGTIVWVIRRRDTNGPKDFIYDIGVEFTDISEENRQRIENLVNDILGG